jgi:hypothetical protein
MLHIASGAILHVPTIGLGHAIVAIQLQAECPTPNCKILRGLIPTSRPSRPRPGKSQFNPTVRMRCWWRRSWHSLRVIKYTPRWLFFSRRGCVTEVRPLSENKRGYCSETSEVVLCFFFSFRQTALAGPGTQRTISPTKHPSRYVPSYSFWKHQMSRSRSKWLKTS